MSKEQRRAIRSLAMPAEGLVLTESGIEGSQTFGLCGFGVRVFAGQFWEGAPAVALGAGRLRPLEPRLVGFKEAVCHGWGLRCHKSR